MKILDLKLITDVGTSSKEWSKYMIHFEIGNMQFILEGICNGKELNYSVVQSIQRNVGKKLGEVLFENWSKLNNLSKQ